MRHHYGMYIPRGEIRGQFQPEQPALSPSRTLHVEVFETVYCGRQHYDGDVASEDLPYSSDENGEEGYDLPQNDQADDQGEEEESNDDGYDDSDEDESDEDEDESDVHPLFLNSMGELGIENRVLSIIKMNPQNRDRQLIKMSGLARGTFYKYKKILISKGVI